MKNAAHTFPSRFTHHRRSVVIGVACVNDDRTREPLGKLELHGECATLEVTRGVVVVIVQSAFANGGSTGAE